MTNESCVFPKGDPPGHPPPGPPPPGPPPPGPPPPPHPGYQPPAPPPPPGGYIALFCVIIHNVSCIIISGTEGLATQN